MNVYILSVGNPIVFDLRYGSWWYSYVVLPQCP